jgi:hypothetical protein
MLTACKPALLLLAIALLGVSPEKATNAPSSEAPAYTSDGQFRLPDQYRDWVWLTSDFHTASDPAKVEAGHRRWFNNIFAAPEAYKVFLQTGTWPDKTMLVVEQRATEDMGSFTSGRDANGQSSVIGIAVHVKDEARFSGKWAFFGFQVGKTAAKMRPATASCYSCHAARGAVDTTFVQFYPTLLPTARSKNTLSPAYLRDETHTPSTK